MSYVLIQKIGIMAKLTLRTDIDCKVYVDTEFYGTANVGEEYIIELPLGAYYIECKCSIDSTIYYHFDVKINSVNDEFCHNVELKTLRYAKLIENYDYVAEFINGFAKVIEAGDVFFINEDGKKAYDYISPFIDDRAIVACDRKFGVINDRGEIIIDVRYDFIDDSANGRYLVLNDGKYGIVSKDGCFDVPIIYDWIVDTEYSYIVQLGGKYGLVDRNNNEILPIIYERIEMSCGKLEVYSTYNGWDSKDNVLVAISTIDSCESINVYDSLQPFHGNYLLLLNGKHVLIDSCGKMRLTADYIEARNGLLIAILNNTIGVYYQYSFSNTPIIEFNENECSIDNIDIYDIYNGVYVINTPSKCYLFSSEYFIECDLQIAQEFKHNEYRIISHSQFIRTNRFIIDVRNGKYYDIIIADCDNVQKLCHDINNFADEINYIIDQELYVAYNDETVYPILFSHIENNTLYLSDKSGWIKPNGAFSSIIYDQITIHDNKNIVEVCINGKCGLYTNEELPLLPLEYSKIFMWRLQISKNNKYAKLDSSYRKITPLKYDKIEGDTVLFESKWGFINDKGEEITPLKYDEIRGNTARIGDKWMLIGDNGEELTTPIFDEILNDSWENRKVGRIVRQGELFALYNNGGKCVIPMGLYKIEILTENFALIQQDGLYGLYDISKGKEALPVKYQDIITYNQQKGWSASSIDKGKDVFIIKNNNKFGCFSANGWIVECIYAKISINGNVIVVQDEEGKYGAFDINGNKIVACKYTSITRSRCGNYLKAYIDKQQYIIFYNHCGEVKIYTAIVEIDVWDFYNESECRLIFANKGGKVIDWDYGRIQIDGGLWACIDQLGNNITPFKYDCLMFNEVGRSHKFIEREHSNTIKFLKVGINGKVGFINSELQEIIPIVYDDCCIVGENMISVCNNGKDGLVDFGNNKLSDIIYDHIGEFNNEIAIVKQDELYGIINNQGVLIHPCKYPYISFDFISGYNEWGGKKYRSVSIPYVSYEKECVHEGEADLFLGINGETYDFVYNDIFAKKNGKWGIINEEKTLFIYQSVCWDSTMDKVHCKMRGFHGVVDYAGNIIIPFIYDSLQIDGSSYIVEQDGEKFYLDENGIYERPYTDEDEKDYYYDDTDWERESYIALGGDPERYYDGCLDDHIDSIGL